MLAAIKRVCTVIGAGLMFLVVSVLCGLLVAGLAVPFAAASGVSARTANDQLSKIPAELTTPPQAQRTTVLDVNGDVLAYFYDENRVYVSLNEIAPVMRSAMLSIEDHRFYQHGAFDPKGTIRAFLTNQTAGGTVQGGSSISQQYVKMVQVNQATLNGDKEAVEEAQETSYDRKIAELKYAIALEKELSKDQILERYLNLAYFGDGAYGVEAAARHYFGTSAGKLTLPQAAMLAGLVQSPDAYNPVNHKDDALDRRDEVIRRMAELGEIGQKSADKALETGFDQDQVRPYRDGCVGTRFPFLCDYVRRSLLQTPSLGKTVDDREKAINRGGLVIETAIDPQTQETAQRAVSKMVGPTDPLISTMNMIQPGTGLIVAMAQSRPVMGNDTKKGETYFNYSATQDLGGGMGYQAGSTFKAFTAAAALEKGIPIKQQYNAKQKMDFSNRKFNSCERRTKVNGKWKVQNSTGRNGKMDMAKATAWSVNTYFVQLELGTGMCAVTRMAEKVGAESSVSGTPISSFHDKPSFTLGTIEVSPMSMAEAYATFASGGIHCDPIIIDKITTPSGKELAAPSANCQRVIAPEVAAGVSKLLSGVINGGSAPRAELPGVPSQAGKTGTIDNNSAVWFVGYTPQIAGASMISIDATRSPFHKGKKGYRSGGLKGFTVPSTGDVLSGSGGGDAAPNIWKPAMSEYLKGKEKTRFGSVPKELIEGKKVKFPSLTGLKPDEAIKKLESLGMTVVKVRRPDGRVPEGNFVRFSPDAGTVPKFGTVKAVYSSGRDKSAGREKSSGDSPTKRAPASSDQ